MSDCIKSGDGSLQIERGHRGSAKNADSGRFDLLRAVHLDFAINITEALGNNPMCSSSSVFFYPAIK
jgi:hypothetical protein